MAVMEKMKPFWVAAVLVAAVLAVYGQTAGFDFVMYDDGKYVTGNAVVKSGLTLAGVRWALTSCLDANWFPLTWLSHLLTVQFFPRTDTDASPAARLLAPRLPESVDAAASCRIPQARSGRHQKFAPQPE